MLVVLLVVAAAAAVVFAGLFVTTRSAAATARSEAEQRETSLRAEVAEAKAEIESVTAAKATLEADLEKARAETKRVNESLNDSAAEVRRLGSRVDELTEESESRAAESAERQARIEELETQEIELRADLERAESAAASARARASGIVIGELTEGGTRPETLWNLELTRSERTWRTSVSTNPMAPGSPFDDTDDPVRTAVEIEAAALRENVGAFITIDWQADPVDDPIQRHLIVRVAQELLESAARSPEPSILQAVQDDDGHVSLSLGAADTDDQIINLIPPQVTDDLLDFRSDDGLSITVKTN